MRCTHCLRLVTIILACMIPATGWAQGATDVTPSTATAADAPAPEASTSQADGSLMLLEAFASGYFEIAAIAALELYSTAGVIYVDFEQGVASGDEAIDALENPALLHSAVTTTLGTVYLQTAEDQQQLRTEVQDLAMIYDELGELYTLLIDVFAEPQLDRSSQVEAARQRVDRAIDEYFGVVETEQD